MKQCSDLFIEVFTSHGGGCCRVCDCGITHFDTYNHWDWDKGELEEMEKARAKEPDKYTAQDNSIGTIDIDGREIVIGCSCKKAMEYENFILKESTRIAEYLNKRAKQLEEKAKLIKV